MTYKRIDNKTIALGILARNCKESLLRNIPRVEAIGQVFMDYHVVIYENDSKDGTVEALQAWSARNPHVTAICEQTHEQTIPNKNMQSPYPLKSVHRIERMARFRNRVLDEVRRRYEPDLFCFIDIDVEGFEPVAVVDAICHAPADWGALFASGHYLFRKTDGSDVTPAFQYDSYAFVPEGVDPMATGRWVVEHQFHDVTSWLFEMLVRRHNYLSCVSAFNGIGIYRWEAIRDLNFTVMQTPELEAVSACFCEHVPFNMAIRGKGFRNYVARQVEVTYYHKKWTWMRCLNHWLQTIKVRWFLTCGHLPYAGMGTCRTVP